MTQAARVPATLSAAASQTRNCFAGRTTGRGLDGFAVTATVSGVVRVRLDPVNPKSVTDVDADWDVAVFDATSNALIAASAAPRSYEVADGHVAAGQKLWVQGCRYAGRASKVAVAVGFYPTAPVAGSASGVMSTATRTTASAGGLPSGRRSYRQLWDYEFELKDLARRYPSLVKSIVLPERSYEGRDISGIEITHDVSDTADGKPIFANLGLIHAREWPSGELPMEWAIELVHGYGHVATTTKLLDRARAIVVPVVNPDGFATSRGAAAPADGVQGNDDDYSYQRKNCDPSNEPASRRGGICPANPAGISRGTDLNRNFAAFWGGPGSDPVRGDDTYRGNAPFSEPESRDVRDLITSRQITDLLVNHTAAGLVLRPPGVAGEGTPVDEPVLARLGQSLSAHNGYPSIPINGLTEAAGGADEWAYWVGGSLALTDEIGTQSFHPAFSDVIAEYLGRAPAVGAGKGGNREAYFAMLADTAKASEHSVITGSAPKGWTLRLSKTFQTATAPVELADGGKKPAILVRNTFTSTLRGTGGRFSWAVNPSTRPIVAGRYGRDPVAPPQATATLVNPPGVPPIGNDQGTSGPHEEATFTVQGPPKADNGSETVTLRWKSSDDFWYADVETPDGGYLPATYSDTPTSATITLTNLVPGTYRVNVVNGNQDPSGTVDDWTGQVSFTGPTPAVPGVTEPWLLTCRRPNGSIAGVKQLIVTRGHSVDAGRICGR